MRRVLLIEDNQELAFGIAAGLRYDGVDVRTVGEGWLGLAQIPEYDPDIVILDLGLPDVDGFDLLERLRREYPSLPLLVLTARGEERDVVRGLQAGADDYVAKPVSLLVLRARLRALARREERARARDGRLVFGEFTVDIAGRRVTRQDRVIELSPKEFDLLLALHRREGGVASRRSLLQDVWGYAPGVRTRTVDIHIRQLRTKLGEGDGPPRHIQTVWGVGYRFVP